MNEILKQAAYLWMSVAKILTTNDLCEQRMHCAHMQRLKQESPAVADKPARRFLEDCSVWCWCVCLCECVMVCVHIRQFLSSLFQPGLETGFGGLKNVFCFMSAVANCCM